MARTVLITGGAGGIGSAIAKRFYREGWRVVITYHKNAAAAQALREELPELFALQTNIADPKSVNALADALGKMTGGTDVLVNNAGIAGIKLFTDFSAEELTSFLDVDLKGAMLVSKACIPHMVSNQYGRIINIGSMWGSAGASCEVPYSAAKAGLIGFTKALAKELGPSGITVNCVAPGLIDTAMNASVDQASLDAMVESTPLARIGKPEDVANAVYFFASDEASFITGQVLNVDGGLI